MAEPKAERKDGWCVTTANTEEFKDNYDKVFGKKETWWERRERERNELLDLPPPKEKSSAATWLDARHNTGCSHTWQYEGHGHNDSHYKCSVCGIEDDY